MYKPHTIEQYKVYRFLEENFALEHFLLAPLSRFGLMNLHKSSIIRTQILSSGISL